MGHESIKVYTIVERAVHHTWSIPEFQRGFVWTSTQVRDLAESLWFDYPVGSLLIWNSGKPVVPLHATDALLPSLWVVDGQQRSTALCVLFGRKPYWWGSGTDWDTVIKKYDIRFDVHTKEPPYFWVANAAINRVKDDRYIPLRSLLNLDDNREADVDQMRGLAKRIKQQGLCPGMDEMEVYTRLNRVRRIRDREVVTITVDHELEDVVEIFSRLNSKGTRVTEADIYLGVVAARTPGWVHSTFLPYLKKLRDAGFDVDPNLLFRCITGIGAKKVRFREIPDSFWNSVGAGVQGGGAGVWERTTSSWERLIMAFKDFGILSNGPMPTQAALVTMTALFDKFPSEHFEPALYWFLQASRFGRYSGSGTTSLEEDLRDVGEGSSYLDALRRLLRRFPHDLPLTPDDFLRDYSDTRFGRFLLYLLAYYNGAQDWDTNGYRIGFEGMKLLEDYRPQWHHVFPRGYLEGKVDAGLVDALANIAVIGPSINIRISAKAPMDYIQRYGISDAKLTQQFVDPGIQHLDASVFPEWLNRRAERLAEAANAFLGALRMEFDSG